MNKYRYIQSLCLGLITSLCILGISWSSANSGNLFGIFGTPHSVGSFSSSGNAGRIIIPSPGYTVSKNPTNTGEITLSGQYMFLETVGWMELTDNTGSLLNSPVSIRFEALPSPTSITEWKLSTPLYGWSNNAGWIDFNPTNVSSGLIYRGGGLSSFTGQAWSDTLGWIDFSEAIVDFQNKVKIIGSIGGNKAFDVVYNLGAKFNSASFVELINKIKKNIALMTRGVTISSSQTENTINTSTATVKKLNESTIVYRFDQENVPLLDNAEDIMSSSNGKVRSLIIIGGDLVIDGNIVKNPNVNTSRSLIVVKNDKGQGGNIYIKDNVKNIYTTLIAEGSIFSGDGRERYNDNDQKRDNLPSNQLYIYGSVISRNTIGGSQKNPLSCPYIVDKEDCRREEAAIYDWNYFRTYNRDNEKRSDKTGYDEYSVIIEYDSRLIQDPPPGLTN